MNTESITASPLCWPAGKPRTEARSRKDGRFGSRDSSGYGTKKVSLNDARIRVLGEIDKFTKSGKSWRTSDVIISSDLALRNDGYPRSGQRTPEDPGIAVYFTLDGKQRCIPSDNYLRIEDNLAAVSAVLDALRTMERHGSAMFEAAFTGFTALPGPDHVVARSWRDVLEYFGQSLIEAEHHYKIARKKAHPDHGGSTEQFAEVGTAIAAARNELST